MPALHHECPFILEASKNKYYSRAEILLTFSKSSLAEGRSAASDGSPVCFSILSPLTTVVLTTLLTFLPCTGSTSNSDAVAALRAGDSEKVSWEGNTMSRLLWITVDWSTAKTCLQLTGFTVNWLTQTHRRESESIRDVNLGWISSPRTSGMQTDLPELQPDPPLEPASSWIQA